MKVSSTRNRYVGRYTSFPERSPVSPVCSKDAPPSPKIPVSPIVRAKALADSRWWANTHVSGSTRQELLQLEPCFREIFNRHTAPGSCTIQRTRFFELAAQFRAGVGRKSRGCNLDWEKVFMAVDTSEDGSVDWNEFWKFFSSSHIMGNSLQDYVAITKLLKIWGHECHCFDPPPVSTAPPTPIVATSSEETRPATPSGTPLPEARRSKAKMKKCTHCGSPEHFVAACPKRNK